VVYGREAWTVTNKMEKMLMTWERKILRKIYGLTYENGHWRIKINSELESKYKSQDIVSVIKVRRLEWLGHIIRMIWRHQHRPEAGIFRSIPFLLCLLGPPDVF
jgi:hypothetical protein